MTGGFGLHGGGGLAGCFPKENKYTNIQCRVKELLLQKIFLWMI